MSNVLLLLVSGVLGPSVLVLLQAYVARRNQEAKEAREDLLAERLENRVKAAADAAAAELVRSNAAVAERVAKAAEDLRQSNEDTAGRYAKVEDTLAAQSEKLDALHVLSNGAVTAGLRRELDAHRAQIVLMEASDMGAPEARAALEAAQSKARSLEAEIAERDRALSLAEAKSADADDTGVP